MGRILSSPRVIGRTGKDITKSRRNISRSVAMKIGTKSKEASTYTKGVVSKISLPSMAYIQAEAAKRMAQMKNINLPFSGKSPINLGWLSSPFTAISGLVGGLKPEIKIPDIPDVGEWIRDKTSVISDPVSDAGQAIYDKVTEPFVEFAETKAKFDAFIKLAGIVGVLATLYLIFKGKK